MARRKFKETRVIDLNVQLDWTKRLGRLRHGERWRITLEPASDNVRGISANNHYWGYVVAPLAEYLQEQDETLWDDKTALDYAHYHVLAPACLGYDERTHPVTGEAVLVPKPTHTLSEDEFDAYVDRCIIYEAKMFGLVAMRRGERSEGDYAAAAGGGRRQ